MVSTPDNSHQPPPAGLLLIDDDAGVRAGIGAALQSIGHSVVTCADIESAQVLIESTCFEAIVADVRLSGPFAFEGLDLLRHAAEVSPSARVVLMTGAGSPEMRAEAISRGAAGFLAKPFALTDLEDALATVPSSPGTATLVHVPLLDDLVAGMVPVFHPIVEPADGRIVGYEALTRIATASPLNNPETFFRYADRKRRLHEVELRAIGLALEHGQPLTHEADLFLNIHPHTLSRHVPFAAAVLRAAGRHRVDPHRMVFEITEQGGIDDMDICMSNIATLQREGVRFAFDDVGIAHSHLLHAGRIQPAFLKVSQEFGTGFESDEHKGRIVRSLMALAHDLGCKLILEGVETLETAHAGMSIGIDLLQGFLFGRPVAAAQLIRSSA